MVFGRTFIGKNFLPAVSMVHCYSFCLIMIATIVKMLSGIGGNESNDGFKSINSFSTIFVPVKKNFAKDFFVLFNSVVFYDLIVQIVLLFTL